jgi:hypothetical protein
MMIGAEGNLMGGRKTGLRHWSCFWDAHFGIIMPWRDVYQKCTLGPR